MKILIAKGGSEQEKDIADSAALRIEYELKRHNMEVYTEEITNVLKNTDIITEYDFIYIISYGGIGENGAFQAIVQEKGVPYSGSIGTVSAMSKDKYFFNKICTLLGINIPKFFSISANSCRKEFVLKMKESDLQYPVILKPRFNGGSSVGIKKIYNEYDFEEAVLENKSIDDYFLIQDYVDGDDYISGIIRNNQKVELISVGKAKINKDENFYCRYTSGSPLFTLLNKQNDFLISEIKKISEKIADFFEIGGMGYIDFRVKNNIPYVIELGVMYGISEYSIIPFSGQEAGLDLYDLICFDIKQSLRRCGVNYGQL